MSLASTSFRRGKKLWTHKALDLALGKSFEQHLIGGYRFLMRHYRSGCKIYIFGFSRGAYTARFLNEMIDFAGLPGRDNEEMIPFIWEAFATWKLSNPHSNEQQEAFRFLKVCRDTVCRPIGRVHFLGLFDAVNSIAKFQVNVERRPSSRFIRHAVSIDERRVKFQPVLLLPDGPAHIPTNSATSVRSQTPGMDSVANTNDDDNDDDEGVQDLQEVWFPGGHADIGGGWKLGKKEQWPLSHAPLVWMVQEAQRAGLRFDPDRLEMEHCCDGLLGGDSSIPALRVGAEDEHVASSSEFLDALHLSSTKGLLHDLLEFDQELSTRSVLSWRMMEYFPFGRMHLEPDGAWKLKYWPLPNGSMRDIPAHAEIHISAVRRMQSDANYRPKNLIAGSSGRGVKRAPKGMGIGEWTVHMHKGNPVLETYLRRTSKEKNSEAKGKQ